jgi:hypothetical protein
MCAARLPPQSRTVYVVWSRSGRISHHATSLRQAQRSNERRQTGSGPAEQTGRTRCARTRRHRRRDLRARIGAPVASARRRVRDSPYASLSSLNQRLSVGCTASLLLDERADKRMQPRLVQAIALLKAVGA